MEVEEASAHPTPALRGRVRFEGYDVRGAPPGVHRGLPSPYLTLIVTFDDVPVRVAGRDGRVRSRSTVLGGLHTTPIAIPHDGDQAGIHVSLHPLAARTLLGVPAAALADLDVEVSDVLGAPGRELTDRVAAAPDWAGRFAALDDVLSRGAPAAALRPELPWAWSALVGGARVGDVARTVGWSERHLTNRLRAEVGLTPSTLRRVARFHRARRRILARAVSGGPLGLADLAVAEGYADQPHLNRDFRAFAGCSPTTWLADDGGLVT